MLSPNSPRKALGSLSPNVVRTQSPLRVDKSGSSRLMGKLLGNSSAKENPVSPKRMDKIHIEPRPEEMTPNKELFTSPTRAAVMSGRSAIKSPRRNTNYNNYMSISPKRELSRTQMKLLGGRQQATASIKKQKQSQQDHKSVTSQAKKTRDMLMKQEYSVKFPAGAMGLELEPVIISSERKVGCRVKDFYFGLGYNGVEPEVLQRTIKVGDVIASIDGENMLSAPFMTILEVLTSKRDAPIRSLTFKDITTSWANTMLESSSSSSSSSSSKVEASDEVELTSHSMDKVTEKTTTTTVKTPTKQATSTKTPSTSPAAWKTYPTTPDLTGSAASSRGATPLASTRGHAILALTVSPKAIKALSSSGATRSTSNGSPATRRRGGTAASLQAEVSPSDLGLVLGRVGASIGYGFKGVASKILEPFNDADVKDKELMNMMSRKHELLSELSRSCVLLGAAEEKENDLQSQLDEAKDSELRAKRALFQAEDQLREARDAAETMERELSQSRLGEAADVYDRLERIASLEAQTLELAQSNNQLSSEIDDWRAVVDENKRAYNTSQKELTELREQLSAAEQAAAVSTTVHQREVEKWQLIVSDAEAETTRTMGEMKHAMNAAKDACKEAEQQRDKAVAEAEFLQDISGTERASVHSELQRVKTLLDGLQASHKEEILALTEEQENALNDVKRRELELKADTEALGINLESAIQAKEVAEKANYDHLQQLNQARKNLEQVREQMQESERSLLKARQCFLVHQHHGEKQRIALDTAQQGKMLDWSDFEATVAEKTAEVEEARAQLLESSAHAVSLEARLQQMKKEQDALLLRYQSSSEDKDDSYHQALMEAQLAQDILRTEKEELTLKATTMEGTILEQLAGLEASQKDISALRAEISTLEGTIDSQRISGEAQAREASATQEELTLKLQEAADSINDLQARMGTLRIQHKEESTKQTTIIQETEAQLQQHEALWREEKERAILLEDQKASLQDELEAAQFAWETRNMDVEALEAKIKDAEDASAAMDAELVEKAHAGERMRAEKEHELEMSGEQNRQLEGLLEQERAKQRVCVQTASKACEELSWELKDVRNSVLDLGLLEKEYVSTLRMVETKYRAVVTQLQERVTITERDRDTQAEDMRAQIENLTRDRDRLIKLRDSQAADSDEAIAVTFTRARDAEKLLETAYDEHEDLRKQVSVLKLQVTKTGATVSGLEGELEYMREAAVQAKEQHEELTRYSEEQKFAVVHLRGEISRVVQSLELAENDKKTVERSLENVEREKDVAVDEADTLNDLLREVKAEYQRTKEEHEMRVDALLESQRDLVSEHTKQQEHLQRVLDSKLAEHQQALETAIEEQGEEFELKQAMLMDEHQQEMENTRLRAAKETQKSREALVQLSELQDAHTSLRADKKKLEGMLMAQDEALQVSEGRVVSLKEEIDGLEGSLSHATTESKTLKEQTAEIAALQSSNEQYAAQLADVTESAEATAAREADLVRQREEIMETLKKQHASFTEAIEEKDEALVTMRDEYSQLLEQLDASVRAQKVAEEEAETRVVEVASLRARVSQMTISNDSNLESNMASQDVVKKMATALGDTKRLLTEAVQESQGLLEQRERLSRVLKEQEMKIATLSSEKTEAVAAAEAERNVALQKATFLESTVGESQEGMNSLAARLEAMQADYTEKNAALEAENRTLAQSVAAANTSALSAQQQLSAKQAELDSLHRQCTELIAAAMASPTPSPGKQHQRHRSRMDDSDSCSSGGDDGCDENDENSPGLREAGVRLQAFTSRGGANRVALGELASDFDDGGAAISDLSSNDSHLVVSGMSLSDAAQWHEKLLCYALDMHEAVTFATAEHMNAQEQADETPSISPPLRMASEALRSLHEHILLAPWLDSSSVVPQSLPPAHEMLQALRQPTEHFHTSLTATTTATELQQARETIASLQERLAAMTVALPELKRQDSGMTDASSGKSTTVSDSERIYSVMDELQELLSNKLGGVGYEGGAVGGPERDPDTSIDSLQLGGANSAWKNLQQLSADILEQYRVTVLHRATSKSSSMDRLCDVAASVSRGSSPRGSPRNGDAATRLSALMEHQYDNNNSSGSSSIYDNHVRLSSESADMPRMSASLESIPRLLAPVPTMMMRAIPDHGNRHSDNDGHLVDVSLDSINSQDMTSSEAAGGVSRSGGPVLIRPVAHHHSLSLAVPGNAMLEGDNDFDNSDEVERGEDSGFWNVSAGSIEPLSDDESV